MTTGTLHGAKDSFRTQTVLIAAKYSGASVSLCPNFQLGTTDKTEDFQRKFPFGKVPAFEGKDGFRLVGAGPIASYVSEGHPVAGTCAQSKQHVREWVAIADTDVLPLALAYTLPALSLMENNKQTVSHAKTELLSVLEQLNKYLLTRTFLVGERVTLADITLAANLLLPFQHVFEPSLRKDFGNVTRWFTTVVNQPHFKEVSGDIKLCDTAAQFDGKKFAQTTGATAGAKGDTGGKKDKKKEDKPKAAPKKKEAEPEEEKDAAEEVAAAEPKKKDPFEELPKANFSFDEFKKVYSNEDTVTKAIPFFWDNFDKENMSVWFCEYKYPEELTLVFMSCNLIGGMMQRLDRLRKHGFGSMCLFGENNNSTISGVWFWRGPGLAFELSDDLTIDYSSYNWKKLNPNDEADKKVINEYLAWEGDFGGKKFNQGKIFK